MHRLKRFPLQSAETENEHILQEMKDAARLASSRSGSQSAPLQTKSERTVEKKSHCSLLVKNFDRAQLERSSNCQERRKYSNSEIIWRTLDCIKAQRAGIKLEDEHYQTAENAAAVQEEVYGESFNLNCTQGTNLEEYSKYTGALSKVDSPDYKLSFKSVSSVLDDDSSPSGSEICFKLRSQKAKKPSKSKCNTAKNKYSDVTYSEKNIQTEFVLGSDVKVNSKNEQKMRNNVTFQTFFNVSKNKKSSAGSKVKSSSKSHIIINESIKRRNPSEIESTSGTNSSNENIVKARNKKSRTEKMVKSIVLKLPNRSDKETTAENFLANCNKLSKGSRKKTKETKLELRASSKKESRNGSTISQFHKRTIVTEKERQQQNNEKKSKLSRRKVSNTMKDIPGKDKISTYFSLPQSKKTENSKDSENSKNIITRLHHHKNKTSQKEGFPSSSTEVDKYITVKHLTLDQLEKMYDENVEYLCRISAGKEKSWRHDLFKSCFHSINLKYVPSIVSYTDSQILHLIALLCKTFSNEDNLIKHYDFIMKVLLPELLTKILMDEFSLTREEVLQKVDAHNDYFYHSFPFPSRS